MFVELCIVEMKVPSALNVWRWSSGLQRTASLMSNVIASFQVWLSFFIVFVWIIFRRIFYESFVLCSLMNAFLIAFLFTFHFKCFFEFLYLHICLIFDCFSLFTRLYSIGFAFNSLGVVREPPCYTIKLGANVVWLSYDERESEL